MPDFKVVSEYSPAGDQPQAIEKLAQGLENGLREQVLKGVTGSGKTYTMAKVIEKVNRPTLVLAHNKTLAAQLCEEFREFFPHNAVEYFVSYYDYYQPEAYIPHTDTYIEKDASTNEEIDRLRLSATCALLERRDVIVVSSVSCIYGLGEPDDFARMMISLRVGMTMDRDELLRRLVEDRYERNDVAFQRNMFRVRGDTVELYPAYYKDRAIRVEFFGDEIERITEFHPVTGTALKSLQHVAVYPASHYVTPKDKLERAAEEIERELAQQKALFEEQGKLIEAQRIDQRTRYDVEMMRELGYCSGIENYSRIISQRPAGSPPMTLLDFFPDDFVLFVDESHVTLPQVRAITDNDDMDLYTLGEKKCALYAVIPDNDNTYNFLVSLLYSQVFQTLYYCADQIHHGPLPRHVRFVLDEFAAMPLPGFTRELATMRSRSISASVIIQNMAQIKELYKDSWETIPGNCDTILYLGGNESSTHKYVSEMLGKATIDTKTHGQTKGKSGSYSTNFQMSGRELLTPDEVRKLDNRYALLFIRGASPVMDEKYDLMHHPAISHSSLGGAAPYIHHGTKPPIYTGRPLLRVGGTENSNPLKGEFH